jgi:2-polyprenyl-6-methoxyphenol hydroxylase-like FAD-dependent oxidoreductase
MYEYFQKLGLQVHLNADVRDYFETDSSAGFTVNGQRWEADAVICADGVHSKGRHFVLGKQDPPRSSGYAIYRAWFVPEPSLRENPATSWIPLPGEEDTVMNFIGPNAHTLIATVKRNQGITWVLTHPDEYDIEESWTHPAKVEDALKVVDGWDPRIAEVYKITPPDQLFDHKLIYRDPLPTWVSPKARVILIGDAAHSYVPTSAQGATQAIEDAATIAITLELAGKSQVPLALRTMEKMRYLRCKIGQEMGIETRDVWLKTDWEEVKKNPEVLAQPRPNWLFTHDPQAYAYEEFETAANAVLTGCSYQPRNVPDEGSNHRATDFDEERLANGPKADLDGSCITST